LVGAWSRGILQIVFQSHGRDIEFGCSFEGITLHAAVFRGRGSDDGAAAITTMVIGVGGQLQQDAQVLILHHISVHVHANVASLIVLHLQIHGHASGR